MIHIHFPPARRESVRRVPVATAPVPFVDTGVGKPGAGAVAGFNVAVDRRRVITDSIAFAVRTACTAVLGAVGGRSAGDDDANQRVAGEPRRDSIATSYDRSGGPATGGGVGEFAAQRR